MGATGLAVMGRSGNRRRARTQSATTAKSTVRRSRRVSRETDGREVRFASMAGCYRLPVSASKPGGSNKEGLGEWLVRPAVRQDDGRARTGPVLTLESVLEFDEPCAEHL